MNATIKKPIISTDLIEQFNYMLNIKEYTKKDYVRNFNKMQLKNLAKLVNDTNIIDFINSILEEYNIYKEELKEASKIELIKYQNEKKELKKLEKLSKKEASKKELKEEQIELNQDKKELKKLAKLIEKAPTKKEIKTASKIETMEEIRKVSITNDLITFNFEEYLNNKNTIKELQQKNTVLISDIFKEVSILMVNFKKELETNISNYNHIEFNKKSLINILRVKLENKLNKELFNIYATVLDYMTFNLTIQLNLVNYNQLKSIIKAYKLQLDGNIYFKDITKNAIAKLKNKEDYTAFLKNISMINSQIKKDKLIEEYLQNNKKDTTKKVS